MISSIESNKVFSYSFISGSINTFSTKLLMSKNLISLLINRSKAISFAALKTTPRLPFAFKILLAKEIEGNFFSSTCSKERFFNNLNSDVYSFNEFTSFYYDDSDDEDYEWRHIVWKVNNKYSDDLTGRCKLVTKDGKSWKLKVKYSQNGVQGTETYVLFGRVISPSAFRYFRQRNIASVQLSTATAYLLPAYSARTFSNKSTTSHGSESLYSSIYFCTNMRNLTLHFQLDQMCRGFHLWSFYYNIHQP